MTRLLFALLLLPAIALPSQQPAQQPAQTTWRFDSLDHIGGQPTTIIGKPSLVPTNIGLATHFEGHGNTGDALFVDANPLAGTLPYTFEVIFRPSSAGTPEQRFFHLQESASESRRMFEIRLKPDGNEKSWCLDTVAFNFPAGQPQRSGVMLNCDKQHLFPLDRWYAVAAIYDGTTLSAYVNGILQGKMAVALLPLGPGRSSIGTRINQRDFFTGDLFSARFTPRALPVAELLKVPATTR